MDLFIAHVWLPVFVRHRYGKTITKTIKVQNSGKVTVAYTPKAILIKEFLQRGLARSGLYPLQSILQSVSILRLGHMKWPLHLELMPLHVQMLNGCQYTLWRYYSPQCTS